MKRLVWGIIVVALGLLFLVSAGNNPQGPMGSIVMGLLSLAGGALLIYFGATYLSARNKAGDIVLAMLRESDVIDGRELANRMGMGESKVRVLVADLQRKGIVPFKADIK